MSDTQKQINDWADRAAKDGLSGGVRVLTESEGGRYTESREVGEPASNETRIPDDLVPHVLAVLRERDRLIAAAKSESIVTDLPSLRASCMALAIENIRSKLKDQANVESSGPAGRPNRSEPERSGTEGATQARPEAGTEAPDAAGTKTA